MSIKSLLTAFAVFAASAAAMAAPEVTVSYPTPGSTLDSNQYFASFNLAASGSYSVVDGATATLECLDSGDIFDSTSFSDFMGAVILVKFDYKAITENGEYELVIPAGSITVDGEPNEKITASYILNDPNLSVSEYPQITLVSSDPADGAEIAAIGADALNRISFVTSNDDAVNYIGWSLYDVTNPDSPSYVYSSSENRIDLNRNGSNDDVWENGLYISIGGPDQYLYKGHTYKLNLQFCGIGYDYDSNQYPTPTQIANSTELETYITFTGLTPPTEYSPYVYESVSPDPKTYEIETVEQAMFSITYSGPVRPATFIYLRGTGDTPVAGTMTAIDDEDGDGYASQWEFVVYPEIAATLTGMANFQITTLDADGLYVKGNGEDEMGNLIYKIAYEATVGLPDLISVAPAENAEVESLSEIVVTNSEYQVMAFSYNATQPARILDLSGAEVRVLGEPSYVEGDETQMKWSFDPITEAGTYILMVPKYYFAIGEQFDGTTSKATYFRYFVENSQASSDVTYDLEPISVTPANYSTVSEISSVVLEFGEVTYCSLEGNPTATLEKLENGARSTVIVSEPSIENDWFSPTTYTFNFATPVTEPGTYLFTVAKGSFYDEDYDYSGGEEGRANDELVYLYVIEEASEPSSYDLVPASVTPADNSTVTEIDTVVLVFEEVAFCSLEGNPTATLYKVVDGVETEVAVSEPAVENDWFSPTEYTFTFVTPVKENGTYHFVVAKGSFFDEDYDYSMGEEGKASPELVYTFIVNSSTVGVDAIKAEGNADVYGIDGKVIIRNASAADVKNLPAGLYIFNGKKIIVR